MATNYNKITSLNTDDEIKKAIRALNMRVKRSAKSDLSSASNTLKKIMKFKTDIMNQSNSFVVRQKLPKNLITENLHFSTDLRKLTSSAKKVYANKILSYLQETDITIPGLKKIVKTQAAKLQVAVPEYMKRLDFWNLYREVQAYSSYDSGDTLRVVDIVTDANMSYEDKVKAATEALNAAGYDPNYTTPIKVGQNNTMSAADFRNKMKASRTDKVLDKYGTKKV